MSKIKVITSNLVDHRHIVAFRDGKFEYHLKKQPDQIRSIDCSKITKLSYDKPQGSFHSASGRGLGRAVLNVFSAVKDVKDKGSLTFDAHFSDERYINGVVDMDTYFEIQDAWLAAKNSDVKKS